MLTVNKPMPATVAKPTTADGRAVIVKNRFPAQKSVELTGIKVLRNERVWHERSVGVASF